MPESKNNLSSNSYVCYEKSDLCFGLKPRPLKALTQNYQGPTYVYDFAIIGDRYQKMQRAFGKSLSGVEIYFAMKANSNLEILKGLKTLGSKVDVVSAGEIERALQAGFVADDIIFSGVGKTVRDLNLAIDLSIHQINVESVPELERIAELAHKKNKRVAVALRLNPNISIDTHPYIATGLHENKFGIELSALPDLQKILSEKAACLELKGISLHLGSQMLEFSGFREALKILKVSFLQLRKQFSSLQVFDFGGGLGIQYEATDLQSEERQLQAYAAVVAEELADLSASGIVLQTEPGRWLVGHCGVLLAQVQYVKQTPYKTFLVVDTGMNHLIRPALYEAYHQILPLKAEADQPQKLYDVVGPICESADFFAKNRLLPECAQDDFVVLMDVGAYGFTMANTYNLQSLPREIVFNSSTR